MHIFILYVNPNFIIQITRGYTKYYKTTKKILIYRYKIELQTKYWNLNYSSLYAMLFSFCLLLLWIWNLLSVSLFGAALDLTITFLKWLSFFLFDLIYLRNKGSCSIPNLTFSFLILKALFTSFSIPCNPWLFIHSFFPSFFTPLLFPSSFLKFLSRFYLLFFLSLILYHQPF